MKVITSSSNLSDKMRKSSPRWRTIYRRRIAFQNAHQQTSQTEIHMKENLKPNSGLAKIWNMFRIYCEHSSLHGLRYLGDKKLSLGEKCFWMVAFLAAIACAAYFISTIFQKWNNNPVLISFSPFDVDFNILPFPSITICNMNQVKKNEAERIIRRGTHVEKDLLETYCNSSKPASSENEDAEPATWEEIEKFLKTTGSSCSDMVKGCLWQSDVINCVEHFNDELTDEGTCCSFNLLPPRQIFRESSCISCVDNESDVKEALLKKIYNWSPEIDFPDSNTGDINVVPLRPVGAGTHLGLTVVLDVQKDNYFCSSTSSLGFKIVFSNPTEMPRIENFGFLATPGLEYRISVTPDIRSCVPSVRDIPLGKRLCYFQNERPLYYYKVYTQNNCNLECVSNYTYKECECVPYYLPRAKDMKVCGKSEEDCTILARENMELWYGNGSGCNCLQTCYELRYDNTGTSSKLFRLHSKFGLENISQEYFLENMAVMTFFFRSTKYIKTYKSQIYGFVEALSNIGGLLGLCLGFSFMSFVEIIYFVSLRALCICVKKRRGVCSKKIPFMH